MYSKLCLFSLVLSVAQSVLFSESHELHCDVQDASNLQLLQVSHGMYRASVEPSGLVHELDGSWAAEDDDDDSSLKPSLLAFVESEAEDMTSMHYLLQTSRDIVPLTAKAEAIPAVTLQVNMSVIKAAPSSPAAPLAHSKDTQDAKTDIIILGPEEARGTTIILGSNSVPAAHAAAAVSVEERPAPTAKATVAAMAEERPVPTAVEAQLPDKANASNSVSAQKKSNASKNFLSVNMMWSSPLDVLATWRGSGVSRSSLQALFALFVVALFVVLLLLLLVGAARLGRWCVRSWRYSEEKTLREHIVGMPRSPGMEVVNQLIAGSVYDCAIMRPLSSKQLIRLEARVEEAASGFCLWTPLTQQACVRYTATVSRQTQGASLSVPLSHQSSSIDFVVSVLDAPHVRIEIEGRDLSTFDMTTGRMSAKRTFDSAARHWQEFAMTYQIGGKTQPVSRFRSEHSVLEFQETAIVLGTSITLVGELQRNAVGTLLLRPCLEDRSENAEPAKQEPSWKTSWESPDVQDSSSWSAIQGSLRTARKPWLGKVWVSDDPTLLGTSHKHAKYDPLTDLKIKSSRDCSGQLTEGFVNLISSGGQ